MPHLSPLHGGPQLSGPIRQDLLAYLRAAKTVRGLTWAQVAAAARVPYGATRHFVHGGHPPRLEWAVRLAHWCGLTLVLTPTGVEPPPPEDVPPSGADEFGDPEGDEGEGG